MKEADLKFILETIGRFDFNHSGSDYTIFLDKDGNGKSSFRFGRQYEFTKYSSWGEMMNEAKVENHYFKSVLREL